MLHPIFYYLARTVVRWIFSCCSW